MPDDDQVQEDEQVQEEDVVKLSKEDYETLSERSKKVDELAEELEKLKAKDYNFRKMEESSEKEKEYIKGKVKKKEEILEKEKEELKSLKSELERKHEEFVKDQLASVHKKALDDMCGDDKELRDRVEHEAKMIVGAMNNEDQIRQKYQKAYLLATGSRPEPSPLGSMGAMPSNSYSPSKGKKYTETEQGKTNYDRWFTDKKAEVKPDSLVTRHLYNP